MEIREIVDTVVNELSVVVKFRIDRDSDEVIRSFEFLIRDIEDSGFEVFYKDEFDDDIDENWDEETEWDFDLDTDYQDIDEDELISYMNEFFLINGDLPEPEAY